MALKRPPFTAADLKHLPDDGKRYEVFDGELFAWPASTPYHQRVSSQCVGLLYEAVQKGFGSVLTAPLEVRFSRYRSVQPDVIFIGRERLRIIGRKRIEGAPDLVIEILSEESHTSDLGWKFTLYAQGGVPFYWVLDPVARTVRVYRLANGEYVADPILRPGQTLACPLFPGITTDVARLFP